MCACFIIFAFLKIFISTKKFSNYVVSLYKAVVGMLYSLKACQYSKNVLSLACSHIKEQEIDLNAYYF